MRRGEGGWAPVYHFILGVKGNGWVGEGDGAEGSVDEVCRVVNEVLCLTGVSDSTFNVDLYGFIHDILKLLLNTSNCFCKCLD